MKILSFIILGILLIGLCSFAIYFDKQDKEDKMEEDNEERLYQGPVPEGYNEEHFRKTGETIPLKDKE